MRIISGNLGGRNLKTADATGLRPAMGRTREALFSMLEARGAVWEGARVLDIFAGCGSLAFECLSRGAAFACLVDNGATAFACLKDNIANLNVASRCRIFKEDARKFLRKPPTSPFNFVFVDPPYRQNLANPILTALCKPGWLAKHAIIAAELEAGLNPPDLHELENLAVRNFGQTVLHLWKKI